MKRARQTTEPAQYADDIAFFPLIMPSKTGAGTIGVAITLSLQRPATGFGTLTLLAG